MSDATPPDPSVIGQFGAAVGLGVAAAVGAAWQWLKGVRDGKETKRDLVIEAFDLADMRPLRELVPDIREVLRLIEDLHAKRDRADTNVAAMHTEFREALRDIENRLQKMEVELTVLNRIVGRG